MQQGQQIHPGLGGSRRAGQGVPLCLHGGSSGHRYKGMQISGRGKMTLVLTSILGTG